MKFPNNYATSLEFRVLWCSWKRNDIADIGHSRDELNHAFQTEPEP